ncbi:uncharacterized protein LOC120272168 [Dioscorea cayenensis subsp. rotundata]|uniref:Uncharacterized protein LOC120272168 n=1 Tax=Dioscorea cayennensis subsp. rotundata TaxID=55577 RepID=A0AB40C4W3_DIOCR|nr:uncharacterized protein LOC120272168 [Dioscorea cayenensis subsp. rotundata]
MVLGRKECVYINIYIYIYVFGLLSSGSDQIAFNFHQTVTNQHQRNLETDGRSFWFPNPKHGGTGVESVLRGLPSSSFSFSFSFQEEIANAHNRVVGKEARDFVVKQIPSSSSSMPVTLHTNLGDIKCEIACDEVPKASETCTLFSQNFLALCASGLL